MNTFKLIMIFILIFTLYTFIGAGMKSSDMVQYTGNTGGKEKALMLVDKVLKEQGNFGVYGDLSSGIESLISHMNIRIVEKDLIYSVEIYPKSGSGHDFSFIIDKENLRISGLSVGEIIESPEK